MALLAVSSLDQVTSPLETIPYLSGNSAIKGMELTLGATIFATSKLEKQRNSCA